MALPLKIDNIFQLVPTPNIVLLADAPKFTIVTVNKAFLDLLQTSEKEVIGRGFFEVILKSFPENEKDQANNIVNLKNSLEQVIAQEQPHKLALQKFTIPVGQNVQSRVIYLDAQNIPIKDGHNNVTHILHSVEDITENRIAQQALEESEKKYRQIVETAREGIWMVDKDYRTTFVNDKMCEILEYSREEMLGKKIFSFMDNEGKRISAQLEQLEDKKIIEQIKFKYITKTGKEIWTRIGANQIFDHENNLKGYIAMVTNITTSKNAEERLLQSEKKLKEAQQIAHLGNWELNVITQELSFSEETCRIYGIPPEETHRLSFSDWLSFIHPHDIEELKSGIKKAEKTLEESILNHRIILKNGTTKYIQDKFRFICDRQGKPILVYGVCHDVTKSKKAEEKLQLSETRLKEAQQIANLGNFELDFTTGEAFWSEECCRIYGISPTENRQTHSTYFSFVHPEDREQVMATINESQKTLTDTVQNHRILLKDGTVKYVYSKTKLQFDQNGKAIGLHGINQDITEARKVELFLDQQNKELIKANKELDRFVYSASHDLRSPLGSVMGLISLIEEDCRETETLEHVKMIKTSVNRLDGFIRNILNYSQNNRTELDVEKVPIKNSIYDVVDSLRSMKKAKGIDFNIQVLDEQPFYSDSRRFNAILENLVSNAVKYHTDEEIDRYVKITAITEIEGLKLTIVDNGIGISEVHQDKIFDMFFRISGNSNSSGIGLYIVKKTVEKLNGTIEVESKEGAGTTFIVTLKNLKIGRENAA